MRFVLFIVFLLFSGSLVFAQSTAQPEQTAAAQPSLEFVKYSSRFFSPAFKVEHVPKWIVNEMSGEIPGSFEAYIYEPPKKGLFRMSFTLVSYPLSFKDRNTSLMELTARVAAKYKAKLNAPVLSTSAVGVMSRDARDVIFSYTGQDVFRSAPAQELKRRIVVFRLGDTLMEFHYENTVSEFDLYNRLFEYTLLSLEFV